MAKTIPIIVANACSLKANTDACLKAIEHAKNTEGTGGCIAVHAGKPECQSFHKNSNKKRRDLAVKEVISARDIKHQRPKVKKQKL